MPGFLCNVQRYQQVPDMSYVSKDTIQTSMGIVYPYYLSWPIVHIIGSNHWNTFLRNLTAVEEK